MASEYFASTARVERKTGLAYGGCGRGLPAGDGALFRGVRVEVRCAAVDPLRVDLFRSVAHRPRAATKANCRLVFLFFAAGQVFEACALRHVSEVHRAGGAVPLLGDDDLCLTFGVGIGLTVFIAVVVALAMNEGDNVGILLDRARLAQVGEQRPLVFAG